MVLISYYETDPGYIFYDVAFRYSFIEEANQAIAYDQIVPLIIQNQVRDIETKYFCRTHKDVITREVFLIDQNLAEHRFEVPFSPRNISFWTQMINELNENTNVRSFEVYGERIRPFFLENTIFRDAQF